MRTIAYLAGVLAILMTLNACDRRAGRGNVLSTPTTPTTALPPTNPSPVAPRGEITVRSITPASPATLIARECTYPNTSYTEICSSQLQMAVDVQFANETPNALVTADFFAGLKLCGTAGSPQQPLAAGGRATFNVSAITLSDEGGKVLCPLPAVTTRIVVRLWEVGRPARGLELLTQEFVNTYTFAEP